MTNRSNSGHGQDSLTLPPDIMLGILDNRYEGITIVDHEGIILFISGSTERFFGLKKMEGIGKHVTEIFPGSNLHMVAKSGKAEIGVIVELKGQKKVVSRIPIINDQGIVGAVSKIMFKDIDTMMQTFFSDLQLNESIMDSGRYPQRIEFRNRLNDIFIGGSLEINALRESVRMAAHTSSTVLITGETGSGKEVVAQAIHNLSSRSSNPFISINCSAIPHNLFESELFGYAPGAFTGAARGGKEGMVRLAHNGTLFLDEIAELPLEMQPKLLRVLQEREVRPVGGKEKFSVDFRLICATNKNIEKMVDKGEFRQDLFYRLNVLDITVPPLRERTEDIPELSYYLLSRLKKKMETIVKTISKEVINVFQRYSWKGNIRELDNVLERAINMATGHSIEIEHLPLYLVTAVEGKRLSYKKNNKLKEQKEQTERACMLEALGRTQGNKSAAAKILGIHRSHFYKKMKKYGLS